MLDPEIISLRSPLHGARLVLVLRARPLPAIGDDRAAKF
jgi:hypothetical protein